MKKLVLTLTALFMMAVSASAMSYEQARQQALFLTDKMAYELNLTEEQYEAAYEINLDYLMGVNHYNDLYGTYWERRNLDLSYILLDWQYRAYLNASYFYRPLYWRDGFWHFGIYARYPHRDYFYFGMPRFYAVYRGGHAWHMNGGRSWYHGRDWGHHAGKPHAGMRDGFQRGDYGRGNKGMEPPRNDHAGNRNMQPQNGGHRSSGSQGTLGGNRNANSNRNGNLGDNRTGNQRFDANPRQNRTMEAERHTDRQQTSTGNFGGERKASVADQPSQRINSGRIGTESSTRTTVNRPATRSNQSVSSGSSARNGSPSSFGSSRSSGSSASHGSVGSSASRSSAGSMSRSSAGSSAGRSSGSHSSGRSGGGGGNFGGRR
ncbi:MAG: hypothetical protein IJ196_03720 [Prevotella sp.]|nr:hypothetical protein [Prevotella sp.]